MRGDRGEMRAQKAVSSSRSCPQASKIILCLSACIRGALAVREATVSHANCRSFTALIFIGTAPGPGSSRPKKSRKSRES
jgi:hypothetical protein